jgi:hypothetical protein
MKMAQDIIVMMDFTAKEDFLNSWKFIDLYENLRNI